MTPELLDVVCVGPSLASGSLRKVRLSPRGALGVAILVAEWGLTVGMAPTLR